MGYILVAVALGLLGSALSLPANFEEPVDTIWPIPQRDGGIRWMTRAEALAEAIATESDTTASTRKLDKVRFFLYTQLNPDEPIEVDMDDPETLVRSTFDPTNPTRFMIHGWNGGWTGGENRLIREALLLNGEKRQFNFFAVDWSVYGASYTYITSQTRCSKAGQIVAEFIDWLHDTAHLSFETLALYGHSLGAHVVGFTGKHVQRGKVHTIVGLDPAMPLFNYDKPDTRLSETDGSYVETIQTNGGKLGFYNPIGMAAFYPNGGTSQPGCGLDLDGGCAHGRCVYYFAEALRMTDKNGFHAVGCSEFDHVKAASCNIDANGVRLGDPNNANHARGIYYLETSSEAPFGLGVEL